jgi:hypothetical protein
LVNFALLYFAAGLATDLAAGFATAFGVTFAAAALVAKLLA